VAAAPAALRAKGEVASEAAVEEEEEALVLWGRIRYVSWPSRALNRRSRYRCCPPDGAPGIARQAHGAQCRARQHFAHDLGIDKGKVGSGKREESDGWVKGERLKRWMFGAFNGLASMSS